jgi:arylsulfatase
MIEDGRLIHVLESEPALRGGRRSFLPIGAVAAFWIIGAAFAQAAPAEPAASSKPNILIIWGDDIGGFNINAYNQGLMGYRTPNIDRIAKEGAMFTDWYGQQSCTAGRAAFITGQSPIRTGLTKVGLPGAPEGIKAEDPTHAAQAAGLRNGSVWQEPFG